MKTKKKVLTFYVVAVLVAASTSCQKYNLNSDETDGTGNKKTLAGNTPKIKPLPVVDSLEWDPSGGYQPGDHTQHMQGMAYSESDPSRIYMGQDVSNVWVSTNFGGIWSSLKCEGLGSSFVTSIEVDPVDKNRILASVNCRKYASINDNYQGIYLSTDGGVNWTQPTGGHRTSLAPVRSSTKLLAYAPTSKGSTYASRWYAAFGEGDSIPADHGLLTSGNGGANWTQLMDLPKATFGEDVRGIKVHKNSSSVLFLYGSKGLFKFTGATSASTIAYTKISGANGLPDGDIKGAIYQSDNGNTLIVPVSGLGIYKSTNGGITWTQLYAKSDIAYCYVNEKFPQKMFATSTVGNNQIKISDDGGQNWWSPLTADVKYRAGYSVDKWINKLGGQFAYVLPDPRDSNRVFMHSKSKNYISTDGGHNWDYSDNYYNAASHSSIYQDQMFDTGNAKRFMYFMVDRGAVITTEKGKWFRKFTGGTGSNVCIGGAVQSGTQVMLATIGTSNGKLLRTDNNGLSWTTVRPDAKSRWVVGFNLQKKNVCYQWRERSDDHGVTWNEMPGMPTSAVLCGISINNGDIIYAMKIGNDGNTKNIYRSTNQGKAGSWSTNPIITSTWDLTVPGESTQFVFKVHPTDDNIVYTSSANGEITKWNISAGTHTDLTIIGAAPNVNYFHRFAIDPRNPDIMYAINQRVNTGQKFFRSVNGGDSWENLSDYLPQGSLNGLAVSPVTGEVYISGENGSFVMLPPDNNSSNTAYSVVPYTMHHITAPY